MNRIRVLRNEVKMTQKELGALLNVQESAISKYETEKIPLTDELLRKLCAIFKVSCDYILCVDNLTTQNKKNIAPLSPISVSENSFLDLFRKLSVSGQNDCLKYLEFSLSKEQSIEKRKIT